MDITENSGASVTENPQVTVVSQEEVNGEFSVYTLGLAPEVAVPAQTTSSEPDASGSADTSKEVVENTPEENFYSLGKLVMTPCGIGLVTSVVVDNKVSVMLLTEYYNIYYLN